MKLVLITLLALVALTQASLQDDLNDFKDLIPKFKIGIIAVKHMMFDSEFKKFKNFVQTSEFKENCNILENNSEVRLIQRYIEESGLNNLKVQRNIHYMLNEVIDYSKQINANEIIIPRSVMSFVDEVVAAFSKNDVTKLMKHKISTSPDFKYFHERLLADEFYQLIQNARNSPEVIPVEKLFHSKGLKVDKLIDIAKNVLSWPN